MAEIFNTQINANADFSGLISQVRAAVSELNVLQRQFASTGGTLSQNIKRANTDFSDILRNSGQFTSQFVTIAGDVDRFGRNLDAGRLKLKDYYRTFQDYHRNSASMVKELAKQQVALQNAILQPLGRNARGQMQFNLNIPTGVDELRNKAALASKELSIMNKVMQDGAVQLINWGKNTQWAGRQLTVGLTVPIAAFGKAAADAFRAADQELTRLTKVYGGLSALTTQELTNVREQVATTAKELSASYGVSFKDTIALAADIAATGKEGQDLLKSLQQTTKLSVLGEVDRQEAMKATLAIQNAFKQNTEELADSVNFLNAVENQTSTTLQDLVEAIPKAGPIIKGLGGDVQDLALYLTAMREGGIDASSAANGLKSALGSLINPTKVAKEMFSGFGIDLQSIVTKNAGDLTATILGLQAALETLNPLQKQQALEQLFGKYQFARMGALFDNLGKQGSQTIKVLDLMKASTQEIGAIADRELTMVTESASGRYRRALESLKADLAIVGEDFLNVATKIVQIADKAINFFNKLPDPIKKVLTVLGAFTAISGPIIMLTGVFANFIGYVFKGLTGLRAFFSGAKTFQYITPEIMAAEKAATMFGNTLYSDAAAAKALESALLNLSASMSQLRGMSSGTILPPDMGGGTARRVPRAPRNPGGSGSIMPGANFGHIIPQAGMTPQERANQTFFYSVPFSGEINNAWSTRPQPMGMQGMPMVEGVTSIGGRSAAVNVEAYARYQSMLVVMSTKTKKQIQDAVAVLNMTGRLPQEFLLEFQQVLPGIQRLATNAASISANISRQAQAGIITSQEAIMQIETANRAMLAQLESMAVNQFGVPASRLRMVPGTNQALYSRSPQGRATYNAKAFFRTGQGRMGDVVLPMSQQFGIPLTPEGYQFRNMGGSIYMTNGSTVPGPNVNADVVPAMLTPGEFVLTRDTVAREGADSVEALHQGKATIVPFTANQGGKVPDMQYFNAINTMRVVRSLARFRNVSAQEVKKIYAPFRGSGTSYQIKGVPGVYISDVVDPSIIDNPGYAHLISNGRITRQKINELMMGSGIPGPILASSIRAANQGGSADQFLNALVASNIISPARASFLQSNINSNYLAYLDSAEKMITDRNNPYWGISNKEMSGLFSENQLARSLWQEFSSKMAATTNSTNKRRSTSPLVITLNGPDPQNPLGIRVGTLEGKAKRLPSGQNPYLFAHSAPSPQFSRMVKEQGIVTANNGGMIPGYIKGGFPKFTGKGRSAWIDYLSEILSMRRKGTIGPYLKPRRLTNDDPAHGPIQIGKYRPEVRSRLDYYPPRIEYGVTGEDVYYRGMDPYQSQIATAWPVGSTPEARAQYMADQYARGGYEIMNVPNAQAMFGAAAAKRSGKFFRGISIPVVSTSTDGTTTIMPRFGPGGNKMLPLPEWLIKELDIAKKSGDFSNLIGKTFIMRRSSWSSNPQTAKGFGDFFIESDINNRRMIPVSELTPDLKFATQQGEMVSVNENEFMFGGKFRIKSIGPNGMKVESIPEAREVVRDPNAARLFDPLQKREMGGPVNKNTPYIVGEKGPELFIPKMNGGIVPNYKLGGNVIKVPSKVNPNVSRMYTPRMLGQGEQSTGMTGGPGIMAMMLGQGIGATVGQMAGSAVAGPMGGNVGAMAGMALGQFAPSIIRAFRTGLPILTKTNVALAATTAAVYGLYKGYQYLEEQEKLQATSFGITGEQAKKAGLNYTNLSDKIKEARSSFTSLREMANAAYAMGTASSQGTGLTIKQFEDLKEKVKTTHKDMIDVLNKSSRADLPKVVASFKSQFMGLGQSSKDATNTIAAMVSLSNKTKMGPTAYLQAANITDMTSATGFNAQRFRESLSTGNKAAIGQSADIAIQSMINAEIELTTRKDKALTIDKAREQIMKATAAEKGKEVKFTDDTIAAIKKQNEELGKVLNFTDDINSAFAKYTLAVKTSIPDIQKLSGAQAQGLMTMFTGVQTQVTEIANKSDGPLAKVNAKIKKLQDAVAAGLKAQRGQSVQQQIDSRKAVEAIDKEIARINKKYDAMRKALELQKESADFQNNIQQAQLEYDSAVASGNTQAAAAAKLKIQSLDEERQRQLALQAIEDQRQKELEAQEKKKKALSDAAIAAQDKMALALDSLAKNQEALAKAQGQKESFTANLTDLAMKQLMGIPMSKEESFFLEQQYAGVGGKKGKVTKEQAGTVNALGRRLSGVGSAAPDMGSLTSATIGNNALQAFSDLFTSGKAQKMIIEGQQVYLNQEGPMFTDKQVEELGKSIAGYGYLQANKEFIPKGKDTRTPAQKAVDEIMIKAGGRRLYGGGSIIGPGTGTSDSIPAMLSNGEYVLNAKAVSSVGVPFLDSINRMAMGGYINPSMSSKMSVPAYKMGGAIYNVPRNRVGFASGGAATPQDTGSTILNFIFQGELAPSFENKLKNDIVGIINNDTKLSNIKLGTTRRV